MGYQVNYKYHKEITKGEYNKDEVFTGDIKVGSPYEEVPVEVLAGKLMALMARRNVLVVDIEVFEIEKKKIAYREMEDGIVIRNKKFRFDDGPALEGAEEIKEDPKAILADPRVQAALRQLNADKPVTTVTAVPMPPVPVPAMGRPIRSEIYRPEDTDPVWIQNSEKLNGGRLSMTPGKRYAIYEEKLHPAGTRGGMLYITLDDTGKKVSVSDKLFQLPSNLVGGESPVVQKESPKLMYQEKTNNDMPVIRR